MCRMIVFGGTCPRCGGVFSWSDLTQHLSCLEAKNAGSFGRCHRGVQMEEHTFNQECDECAAEIEADEGYFGGGLDDLGYDMDSGASSSRRDPWQQLQPISTSSSSAATSAAAAAAAAITTPTAKTKTSSKARGKAKKSSSPDPRLDDGKRQKRQRTS